MIKTKNKIKTLSLALVLATLAAMLAVIVPISAAEENYTYVFDVSKNDVKIGGMVNGTLTDGTSVYTQRKDTDTICITGTTDTYNILLDSNYNMDFTVTLKDVNIDTSGRKGDEAEAAVQVVASGSTQSSGGTVTIKLEGNNSLISGTGHAGIEKSGQPIQSNGNDRALYNTLIIGCTSGIDEFKSEGRNPLTYNHVCDYNCGTLYAKGGNSDYNGSSPYRCGAGIGTHSGVNEEKIINVAEGTKQSYDNTLRNLYIVGGNITAVGGKGFDPPDVGGAGIGTGSCEAMQEKGGSVENLNIVGGNVIAQGGSGPAACIGGGYRSGYVTLTIYSGDITAVEKLNADTNNSGAGIGGGGGGNQSGAVAGATVNIYGGKIIAQGARGAAIGAGGAGNNDGSSAQPANINIYGGDITATTIEAEGGFAAAIGTGGPVANGNSAKATILITGNNTVVRATSANGADIGGGATGSVRYQIGGVWYCGNGGDADVTINGGTIFAQKGGIGGGKANEGIGGSASVSITGGTIKASSIGGGNSTSGNGGSVSKLNVTGGTLILEDSDGNLGGIGGGNSVSGNGGDVTDFTLGNVTVEAGFIGGGNSETGKGGNADIRVNSGTLNANRIGGGASAINTGGTATITVNDGKLSATTIGGGTTISGIGGEADITVVRGNLIADSIGGGNASASGRGGNATITVNGGHFTVAESIGGGTSNTGYGGTCNATFTGGTIRAYAIGGGLSQTYGYSQPGGVANAIIVITGGTLNSMMTVQPTNGAANGNVDVFQTALTLYKDDKRLQNSAQVETIKIDGCTYYGTNDVFLDESGMVYLWIAKTTMSIKEIELVDKADEDECFAGYVYGSETGVLKWVSTKNYFSVHFPFDDRYTVSYDSAGTIPIKGVWAAAMGEAVSFYVHPKEYATEQYYGITAYRSNDDTYTMDYFEADDTSTETLYYFKMTVVSDTEIIIAAAGQLNDNRISLDLSQNSVVLHDGEAAIGGYKLDLTGIDHFLLTSGGLPTDNSLRVEAGEHTLYTNWINANSADSIIEVNGGKVNLTASETDNRIVSVNSSPISVADGATLNITLDGADSLTVKTEANSSVIGGAGAVNIVKTSGFLVLEQPIGSSAKQISASEFSYKGQFASGQTTLPYTLELQVPPDHDFFGYNNGTSFVTENGLGNSSLTYTACTAKLLLPDELKSTSLALVLESGMLSVPNLPNTYGIRIWHDGEEVGRVLNAETCRGDILVVVVDPYGVTYSAENVTNAYTGSEQEYDGIFVMAGDYVTSVTILYNGTTVAPVLTNVGYLDVSYQITYNTVNSSGKVVPETPGTVRFEIINGINEWELKLVGGAYIEGETPKPHAVAKWEHNGVYYKWWTYDEENENAVDGWVDNGIWDKENNYPIKSGLYKVQAFVKGTENYPDLSSEEVLLVIDKAAIFYAPIRDYTPGYQGYSGGTVELDKNKVFTAYYSYYYEPSASTPLVFTFVDEQGAPLPVGTTITLLYFENNGLRAYYYEITEENRNNSGSISSTSFINMGELTASGGFEPYSSVGLVESIIKFCIELPKGYSNSFIVKLEQPNGKKPEIAPELDVIHKVFMPATLEISGESELGKLTAEVTVGNIVGNTNALVVELLDENDAPVFLPDGVVITLNGQNNGVSSGRKVFFGDISANTYALTVDIQGHFRNYEQQYKLKLTLCESPQEAVYSMADAVAKITSDTLLTAEKYTSPSITVTLTNGDRYVERRKGETGFTIAVTGTGDVPSGTEITCKVYQVEQDADGNRTAVDAIIPAIPSTFENGTQTNINLPGVDAGTYLLLFRYGNTTYRYTIIVTE